jgi:hypothetical protein
VEKAVEKPLESRPYSSPGLDFPGVFAFRTAKTAALVRVFSSDKAVNGLYQRVLKAKVELPSYPRQLSTGAAQGWEVP